MTVAHLPEQAAMQQKHNFTSKHEKNFLLALTMLLVLGLQRVNK